MLRGSWILFLILFAVLADDRSALGQRLSSASDLAGLFSLRASLGLRARDWPRNADPCAAWAGVGCRGGRVVSLNVSGFRRTRLGRLNPRFAVDGLRSLSRLVVFNASGFPLPGPIPDWFGSRLPLTFSVLVLRRSAVNGSIPYSLGGVASLSVLDLAGNSITGNIPPTLGQLGNLSRLDLFGNELTGSIPDSLGALPNLTYLDLSNNSLTGHVPLALGTLPKLNTLVLTNNSLDGSVPPQLGDLASLVKLDLGLNSLSGTLPDDLKNLRRLQVLDLSRNSFTGPLSRTLFSGLSSLRSVALSHNNFSGALPEMLWSLSGLQFLDVSSNNLTGTIPDLAATGANASGSVFNISNNLYYGSIPSGFGILLARFSAVDLSGNYFEGLVPVNNGTGNVSFASNCFRNAANQRSTVDCQKFYKERELLYDGPVPQSGSPPPSSSHKKSSWSWKYILIGVLAGIAFLGVLIFVIVLCLLRRGARATDQRESTANVVPSGAGLPASAVSVSLSAVGDSFTYDQLLRATADFNDSNLIKHGHSGDLYRGVLEDAIPVVVKRINISIVKREAYVVELDLFAKASHARLVPFIGHCLENENEKLLVYKHMPHGDLSNALYKNPGQDEEGLQSLDWITRLKIATGVAEALCFLHHECTPSLVHRDVQASSILLDDKFEVRLGSLSEVCTQEGDSHQNVVTRFLRLSSQSSEQGATGSPSATCAYDVYCLGKVLLELVTGKLGISGSNDASTNQWLEHILPYISIYEKDMVTKIVDPSLIVDEDLLEEVWAMAIVAKSCLNPKPSKRPLVRYILKALENPLKVVREENNSSSSARLRATSSRGSWNAALFRSWRYSSSDNIAPTTGGPPREDRVLKRSGTMRSQGSGGEHSASHRKPSKEIFPEPSGLRDTED